MDRMDQLFLIVKTLGTENFVKFVNKYNIPVDQYTMKAIGRCDKEFDKV
jgi:hypothetical protein